MGTDHASDEALLRRAGEGDCHAFEALVRRHGGSLRRFAAGLVGNGEADDALQQGLVAAYRGAASFRGQARARTWLFTVVRNAALRHRRREARHAHDEEPDEDALLPLGLAAGWGADPEKLAVRAQVRARLERALASLAETDREVLMLRDVEGLAGPEAAAVLGLELPALKSRLHRARLRLAGALRAEEDDDA
ncbi:MAG: sigma-70 family RNA polymerase sigma factor [Myxococcota bacterium]